MDIEFDYKIIRIPYKRTSIMILSSFFLLA
jgi:hypothetical protein